MAGAKLYLPKDFLKTDPEFLVSRIPVKIKRAESYAKEEYEEAGYGAVFEALEGTRKNKSQYRERKTSEAWRERGRNS